MHNFFTAKNSVGTTSELVLEAELELEPEPESEQKLEETGQKGKAPY